MESEGQCLKCGNARAVVLVRQRERLCKDCLCESVEGKFRSLFKTKSAIQPNDRVLLELSGTVEAQTALHLLLHYRNSDSRRLSRGKTYFTLHLLHLVDENSEETSSVETKVQNLLLRHEEHKEDIDISRKTLESVNWSDFSVEFDETVLKDLERIRRRNVILEFAKDSNYNVVISLQTATSLAQEVLTQSCKGIGYSIPEDTALFDRRHQKTTGATLVRLLKDLSTVELTFYCRLQEIETTSAPLEDRQTVDSIAEKFIHSLSDTFPSGVSSILSMSSKLQSFDWQENSTEGSSDDKASCVLCEICSSICPEQQYCHSCVGHIIRKLNSLEVARLRGLLHTL